MKENIFTEKKNKNIKMFYILAHIKFTSARRENFLINLD